ncbi:KAP family P-loop NTPase fold protein [Klebsiella aerogenes]|uniref:KAP family P-loop NTPase fold protein n=1 Tax=Klebsiella aerogenes TaxID=548 RepID=UPI00292FFB92|nr:P-loop NTPase fold protein [Klebsiella aerogenes]
MNITTENYDFSKGFDISSDIFERKPLFEQMKRLVINSPDENLVFALDDIWGSGKTSFVKMLKSEFILNHREQVDVIYFDAFENDYQSDPFISISSELYALLDSKGVEAEEIASKVLKAATKIGIKTLAGGAKVAINALTAGVVNDSLINSVGKAFGDSINSEIESFVQQKIKSVEEEKKSISDFKKALEDIYKHTQRKTLIIIDELDRARPDYALELLEKIKHLFSVKGLVFLLVMNREQFEKGITFRYGDIDTTTYLNKFIHYWFTLPKLSMTDFSRTGRYSNTTIAAYMNKLLRKNNSLGISHNGIFTSLTALLIESNNYSLREAERCISTMLVVDNHEGLAVNENLYYMSALALVCFLKVTKPSVLKKVLRKESTYQDILRELNISEDEIFNYSEPKVLSDLLEYHYLDPMELEKGRQENNPLIKRIEGIYSFDVDHIQDISSSLNNMIVR